VTAGVGKAMGGDIDDDEGGLVDIDF
jgi:hypothetical protein